MKPLREVLKDVITLFNKTGDVSLCLHFNKKGGARKGIADVAVTVVEIGGDHIMVVPKKVSNGKPAKTMSIALGTNVRRIESDGASFLY